MKFILRLKHWQLFLIVIGVPILADIFGLSENEQMGTVNLTIGILTVSTVFTWIWTIANELHKLLPAGQNLKLWIFRAAFLLALTLLIFLFWLTENETIMTRDNLLILIFIGIPVYLGLMIYVVSFAAKTLKTVELGRLADAVYVHTPNPNDNFPITLKKGRGQETKNKRLHDYITKLGFDIVEDVFENEKQYYLFDRTIGTPLTKK